MQDNRSSLSKASILMAAVSLPFASAGIAEGATTYIEADSGDLNSNGGDTLFDLTEATSLPSSTCEVLGTLSTVDDLNDSFAISMTPGSTATISLTDITFTGPSGALGYEFIAQDQLEDESLNLFSPASPTFYSGETGDWSADIVVPASGQVRFLLKGGSEGAGTGTYKVSISGVPEASTTAMMALAGFLAAARRKRS